MAAYFVVTCPPIFPITVMSNSNLNNWLFPSNNQECFFVDEDGHSSRLLLHEEKISGANIFFAQAEQATPVRMKELLEKPQLSIYFSLEGDTGAESATDLLMLKGQQHLISYKPHFDGYYLLNSPMVRNFGVLFEESFFNRLYIEYLDVLKRFWDKVHARQDAEIMPSGMPLTPRQLSLIHEIANCPFTGQMRQVYLESKIIELFLFQASQAEGLRGRKAIAISNSDIEKLHAAKAFIRQHMFEPLSMQQISRVSGLNEFKLKKGFKELFGTTTFGYLNELKMTYARQLILNSQCSILEAAYSVGYGEPYSFTRAFRKHFGYLPSELKK